jgi:hypothetical protein
MAGQGTFPAILFMPLQHNLTETFSSWLHHIGHLAAAWMDCGKAPGSYAGRTPITTTDPTARTTFLVATQALAAEAAVIEMQFISGDNNMSDVTYVSKVRIERKVGPVRGESQPVTFSVHGDIAKHYKIDPAELKESHASTLDYVIAATAG